MPPPALVFPAPELLISPRPIANQTNVALLRAANQTVWLVKTRSGVWSAERLAGVAIELSKRQLTEAQQGAISSRFSRTGLRDVEAVVPCLCPLDKGQWGIGQFADSLVARDRQIQTAKGKFVDRHDGRLIAAIVADVEAAVAEFVKRLHQAAMQAATLNGNLNIERYNFFVSGTEPRFRMQSFSVAPMLATAAMRDDDDGAILRALIDGATPLVGGLQRVWNVKPAVIRHLIAQPLCEGVEKWVASARQLASLMDALPPDCWPAESQQWEQFNRAQHAVAYAKQIEPGLSWLADQRLALYAKRRWSERGIDSLEYLLRREN